MNLTDRTFNRLVLIALAIGFAALTAASAMALWTVSQNETHERLVEHTYEVGISIGQYQLLLERAEAARRGYLLDRSPRFEGVYTRAIKAVADKLDAIADLTSDNQDQRARVERLRALTRAQTAALDSSIALARAGNIEGALVEFNRDQSTRTLFAIRALSEEMVEGEGRLLAQRSRQQESSLLQLYFVLGGAGVLVLLVGFGSAWAIRRYTTDLTTARDRLNLLNTDLEGAVQARTSQLQRANDEIQRFAYIVSHDLRSPLVNIMGFTAELQAASGILSTALDRIEDAQPDLIDPAARLAVKEDLPEAVGFIRSSTQKMDRLINAILRLSREGRRTLTPELLPMDRVMAEIIATFEQQLTARQADVVVAGKLPDVVSDRVAVDQILSNLIENAIKYGRTDGTGEVRVSGERHGNAVSFAVTDNGRGIAPGDHERVFDLFRRSGSQDQPGEGLGLAHVRALAYRLGGTVTIDSALGEGSTFRLTLPVTYSEREAHA